MGRRRDSTSPWVHRRPAPPFCTTDQHPVAAHACNVTDSWALILGLTLGGGPFDTRVFFILLQFVRSDQSSFPSHPRQRIERSDVAGATWPLAAYGRHLMCGMTPTSDVRVDTTRCAG